MNTNSQINVSNEVLVWARESLALSRNQVKEKTNIPANRLIQLEIGEKQPTIEDLKVLSKVYKRTIATLLLDEPPKEKPLPKDRRTVDSKELGNFHEKTIMAVRKARALAQSSVKLREELGIDIFKFSLSASLKDKPQEVAENIRQLLNLSEIKKIKNINDALVTYIDNVESLGVSVFQLSLTQDNLRGFSIVDDLIPIIVLKRGGEQAHSKTFTLFHELGHILLNQGGLCDLSFKTQVDIEKWCNAFAAEVLVPSAELLSMGAVVDYQRKGKKIWSKNDLVDLANYFHVGPLTILRKLLDNNLTTREYYEKKHNIWNKPQFGRSKEPKGRDIVRENIREKGKTYIRLAFKAFDQNRINLKDLSDFLGVKLSYIPKTRELMNV